LRRGREPYLNREFFAAIAATMPGSLLVILARHRGTPIAAAICFRSATTLYGRYWGSLADFHSLHFETCYYQGIDYCIRERLERFEPGTQGEHKIARGFTPQPTWSCHWLRDTDFHAAVGAFLVRETRHVDAYMDELDDHVPYRNDALTGTRA
jgi:predicted N-acyltransferase